MCVRKRVCERENVCARLFQFMLRIHVHSNQYTFPHMQLSTISVRLLQNLEIFRKEHIQKTKVCAPRVCNVFKCICYTNAFVKLTPSLLHVYTVHASYYCTHTYTHTHTHTLSLPRQEEKKQFDRSSERYYQSLEKKLSVSNKKKESALNEVSMYITLYIHVCLFVCLFTYVC